MTHALHVNTIEFVSFYRNKIGLQQNFLYSMLKYRYVDFKIILMLALACGTLNAEVHWSEWSNCTNTGVCTRRRVVKCDEGEGIECIPRHDTNQAFEEQLRGCSSPLCENRLNLSSIASVSIFTPFTWKFYSIFAHDAGMTVRI